MQEIRFINALRDHGISLRKYHLLLLLEEEPQTIKELTPRLGISGAAATTAHTQLEMDGLVAVERGKADRRVVILTLTNKGRDLLSNVREQTN